MKASIIAILLAGALLVPNARGSEGALSTADDAECPIPRMLPPAYPAEALRGNHHGTTLLDLRVDLCGRVVEVIVNKTSGHKSLDTAAIEATRGWVVSPEVRAKSVDGWLRSLPVDFSVKENLVSQPVDWPASHRHAKFVVVDAPAEYDTVAAAAAAVHESDAHVVRPPIINVRHRFVQFEGPTGREYWLFLYGHDNAPVYAARFRPVTEDGVPIVQLAPLCELPSDACNALTSRFLKGLPFAKAGR